MSTQSFLRQYRLRSINRIVKAMLRKLNITVDSFTLMKYNINEDELKSKFIKNDYSDVKSIQIDEIDQLKFINQKKKQVLKDRLNGNNYSCYGIVQNNEIQYITWISWETMNYPTFFRKSEKLTPNQALLEDSYCSPEHRGKGYHSKMNIYRLKMIYKNNKNQVLALVLNENKPAYKVQIKSGFQPFSKITFLKIGNWKKIYQKKLNEEN